MNAFRRFQDTFGHSAVAHPSSSRTKPRPAAVGLLLLTLPLAGCRHDALKSEIAAMERNYHLLVQQSDQISLESKRHLREMEPLHAEIDRKKAAARKDTAAADELNAVQQQVAARRKEIDSLKATLEAETKRFADYTAVHARP